jgi:hypothetical protein
MQTPVIAQLHLRQVSPRNLRRNNPDQNFFPGSELLIDRFIRDAIFCANLVPVVPINQDSVPKHECITATVLNQVFFKQRVRYFVKSR